MDVALGDDAEAGCELDKRQTVAVDSIRMRAESELRSL